MQNINTGREGLAGDARNTEQNCPLRSPARHFQNLDISGFYPRSAKSESLENRARESPGYCWVVTRGLGSADWFTSLVLQRTGSWELQPGHPLWAPWPWSRKALLWQACVVVTSTGSGVSGLNPGSASSCVTLGKLTYPLCASASKGR